MDYSKEETNQMDNSQPLEWVKEVEQEASGKSEEGNEEEEGSQEEEAVMGMPFGLIGATFLCNILQYAVFLGITMVILIIIRVFMPAPMQ